MATRGDENVFYSLIGSESPFMIISMSKYLWSINTSMWPTSRQESCWQIIIKAKKTRYLLRSLRWRRITRYSIACLFRNNVHVPLGIAVLGLYSFQLSLLTLGYFPTISFCFFRFWFCLDQSSRVLHFATPLILSGNVILGDWICGSWVKKSSNEISFSSIWMSININSFERLRIIIYIHWPLQRLWAADNKVSGLGWYVLWKDFCFSLRRSLLIYLSSSKVCEFPCLVSHSSQVLLPYGSSCSRLV